MRGKGRPAEPVLSVSAIVSAAMALIGSHGAASFSVNSLAAQLGVTPRAVRHRVGSREQLLVAVAERVMQAIDVPAFEEMDYEDYLRLVATAVRAGVVDNAELIPVVLANWSATTRGAELVAGTLDVLLAASAGELSVAVSAHNAFWAFVAGYTYSLSPARLGTIDALAADGVHVGTVAALERMRASYAAAYPGVSAHDVAFVAALDVTLGGIRTLIGTARTATAER